MFRVTHRDAAGAARTGVLELAHGAVETPAFMPVGTNATVKAIRQEELEALGVRLLLSNAYHLYLRPGVEVLRGFGGLHGFMAWERNILTDSGGYQVFSLSPFRRLEPGGVEFRSHLDGSAHRLTPEEVVEIQQVLGSDIMMPLDVCTPPGIGEAEALEALRLTTDWARRSLARWRAAGDSPQGRGQALFAIVQGNFFPELRRRSAGELLALDFPGYAIGGLSVGEEFGLFRETLALTAEMLPAERPRYLMGVGTPEYILEAVGCGIDLFDCVFPTRTARNAQGFTRRGPVSLKTERNKTAQRPIDPACSCPVCRRYSLGYLRHLFKTREILAAMLATQHNLHFIATLVAEIRRAIREGRFDAFRREVLAEYAGRKPAVEGRLE